MVIFNSFSGFPTGWSSSCIKKFSGPYAPHVKTFDLWGQKESSHLSGEVPLDSKCSLQNELPGEPYLRVTLEGNSGEGNEWSTH